MNQFTDEQAIDIIARAESLRQYEERRKSLLENGLIEEIFSKEETIDKKTLHEIAEAKGIDISPKYVDEIIKRFYPSKEERIEYLDIHNSRLSSKALKMERDRIIQIYKESILGELKKYSYDKKYKTKLYSRLQENLILMSLNKFLDIYENKKKLCSLKFSLFDYNLTLFLKAFDPSFLSICGDVILKLNQKFEKHPSLDFEYFSEVHYNPY